MAKTDVHRIIFLSAILCILGVSGKSVDLPLWKTQTNEEMQELSKSDDPLFDPRSDVQDFDGFVGGEDVDEDGIEDPDDDDDDAYGMVRYDKRGFSILTRWKPFNRIGKQRTSIRDISRIPFTAYDVVSAETRAFSKPSGEPLRWG
ncbi:PREDICTED: uncharacterized protein LOC108569564 [Nicrophorus vespilloides]|uniref:Uncharacterized protein LOC108569564 n=1 Tax=Nicrophorus vespilloides TaxID=110193 RepID=A0ABM1NIJ1_NICVS|nr:PREDICTED: uncharacterized protein LOC108569564 [Nicrophorus vespilloides]